MINRLAGIESGRLDVAFKSFSRRLDGVSRNSNSHVADSIDPDRFTFAGPMTTGRAAGCFPGIDGAVPDYPVIGIGPANIEQLGDYRLLSARVHDTSLVVVLRGRFGGGDKARAERHCPGAR